MEIAFTVIYEDDVCKKDIPHLSIEIKRRVKQSIEKKLMHAPAIFGKPLRQSLKGYRSLRVGDYRIIFNIDTKLNVVKIFCIQHRSMAYKIAPSRET